MQPKEIVIKGARVHNLKNITVSIPRSSLCVISGLSGSGKSSLAFDTLYSEAQRRFVESLSAYARQFLGLMEKPDVDSIEGLSPAIAIEQKTIGHNPRSTLGTLTEIYDYLRLLFANIGIPTCYKCGNPISKQSVQEIADKILQLPPQTSFQIFAPVVSRRKGNFKELLEKLRKSGYIRVRIDSKDYLLDEEIDLKKNDFHSIDVIVDRLKCNPSIASRLTDSLEAAFKLSSNGSVQIECADSVSMIFSEVLACQRCGVSYQELSPRMFSFNSPFGACEQCKGLGYLMEIDTDKLVPDPSLSLADGAIKAWNTSTTLGSWSQQILISVCKHFNIPVNKPFSSLTEKQREILLYGSGDEKIPFEWKPQSGDGFGRFNRIFEGVIPNLLRRYRQSSSEEIREWIEEFMIRHRCPSCNGQRLKKESRSVLIGSKSICDLCAMPLQKLKHFLTNLKLDARSEQIARQILIEIGKRLDFLIDVGLSYLSLEREASSLSGGEAQRIRLATQIGSKLSGVIYILDEPSIGLHAKDNSKLIATLTALRDQGNTVIVIEHDKETMNAADYLIDMGPGAGPKGGEIVAAGTPKEVMQKKDSLTGAYLSGRKQIPMPSKRRKSTGFFLEIVGAEGRNLKKISVRFPLGTLVCVSGVSGSGKSSLINDTLYPAIVNKLYNSKHTCLPYQAIKGYEYIDKVIDIDQSPIGKTPRSNPATYTKIFELIRQLYASLPESKMRGYSASRFSFNVKGGRCESCEGDGVLRIQMHFLPDVYVECEACRGKRYNRDTLEITFKGKNIADVLDMSVDEAAVFFGKIPAIYSKLELLSRVGLGYIHLGQQATTLSGGEAQRIKLAAELAKRSTGKTLYILDEPTTGLHFEDILLLMNVLQELVDKGNTVVIIEHNLDVIKCADYIIDLGPGGGENGGSVVACGTPEEIANNPASVTGEYLKKYLQTAT